jgi:hypothetical protein
VIRFIHRSGAALVAALLLSALLVPASSLAAVPGWAMQVVATPSDSACASGIGFCATVSPAAATRFKVTITNNGKSNIAQLYLTDTMTGAPLSVTPSTGCSTSGELLCSLGSLRSHASVTRTIVYRMPSGAGSLDFRFEANTTGVSGSDGGTSHGDTLRTSGHLVLDGSADYNGGFILDGSNLGTDGTGGQSTTLTPPDSNIGVTIREVTGTTNPCGAGTPIGQLVLLNVSDGQVYSAPFKTALTIGTSGLPDELELSQVKLCHKYDNGTAVFLRQCAFDVAPASNETACFFPKFAGTHHPDREPHGIADADDWSQLVLDLWDFQNGSIRGGF